MTTITLTPELEQALGVEAQRQGTSAERLALDGLSKLFLPVAPDGETARDFLKDFIGVLHSSEHVPGGARLSEHTGEAFTEVLLQKRREGQR